MRRTRAASTAQTSAIGISPKSAMAIAVTESRAAVVDAADAYFTVSEALANVAKHARASAARVEVWLDGALLRLCVADDGIGGAEPARGSGLTGLAQRAASVDGSFEILSPVGGPTTIRMELPCEP